MKYMIAENEAAAMNEEIVGIYHSHPDGEARPSLIDLNYAWPLLSYVVLEVHDFKPADTKSWIMNEDRSGFLPEVIAIQGEE